MVLRVSLIVGVQYEFGACISTQLVGNKYNKLLLLVQSRLSPFSAFRCKGFSEMAMLSINQEMKLGICYYCASKSMCTIRFQLIPSQLVTRSQLVMCREGRTSTNPLHLNTSNTHTHASNGRLHYNVSSKLSEE